MILPPHEPWERWRPAGCSPEGGRKLKNLLSVRTGFAVFVAVLFPIFMAQAQPNTPRIGFVYLAGGRVGATIELKVGGQFLQGVTNAFVTGDGIEAVVTDFNRPMPQGQFNKLRDRLQELRVEMQRLRRALEAMPEAGGKAA